MNFWDILDFARGINKKAACGVLAILFLLSVTCAPRLGTWMLGQAEQRAQANAKPITDAYLKSVQSLPAMTNSVITNSTTPPAFNPSAPVQYFGGHPYQNIGGQWQRAGER